MGSAPRDVRWTNYSDRITLGPEVPAVITTCTLAPAGTHRAKAVVEQLIGTRSSPLLTTSSGIRATRCANPLRPVTRSHRPASSRPSDRTPRAGDQHLTTGSASACGAVSATLRAWRTWSGCTTRNHRSLAGRVRRRGDIVEWARATGREIREQQNGSSSVPSLS